MLLKKPVVVLDLETTGVWIEKDKIIEIAMIKYIDDNIQETYDLKINPGIPIPPEVVKLTGITDEMVKNAPVFKNVVLDVLKFIGDCDLGGFNVERFDIPLLEREIQEAGQKFDRQNRKIFDVQKVYHYHQKRDLTAAYQFYCKKELLDAHSALADTKATLEILKQQAVQYGENDLEALLEFDYVQRNDYYDKDHRFRWWNGKLYMMFGKHAKRYSLQEVVEKDRSYLEWILSSNFSDEVKALVENALHGRFPEFKSKQADS